MASAVAEQGARIVEYYRDGKDRPFEKAKKMIEEAKASIKPKSWRELLDQAENDKTKFLSRTI